MRLRYVLSFISLILILIAPLAALAAETDVIELDGFIDPYVVVNVGCGVPGIIDMFRVDRGDFVKKGQVLAKLDSRVEMATMELMRARSKLNAAIELRKARLKFATREYKRRNELYKENAIPFYNRDEAETNMIMAQCELREAIEQKQVAGLELKQAQKVLDRRTIRSPITGVVVERFLSPGELVEDQPIMKLAQLDPLNVEVIAPVTLWGSIKVGMRSEVRPENPLEGTYIGRVKIVDRVIDAGSGTFGIRIELSNPDHSLPAGLKCRVRFLGH